MEKPKDLSNSLSDYELDIIKEFVEGKETLTLKVIDGEHVERVSAYIKEATLDHEIEIIALSTGEENRRVRITRKNLSGISCLKIDTASSAKDLKELLIKHWEEICQDLKK